jgi:hypothetical protein
VLSFEEESEEGVARAEAALRFVAEITLLMAAIGVTGGSVNPLQRGSEYGWSRCGPALWGGSEMSVRSLRC